MSIGFHRNFHRNVNMKIGIRGGVAVGGKCSSHYSHHYFLSSLISFCFPISSVAYVYQYSEDTGPIDFAVLKWDNISSRFF